MNEMSPDMFRRESRQSSTLRFSEMLEFHSERFKSLAEQYNNKWLNRIKVALRIAEEKTETDIAREEAEIENLDVEARRSKEFEKWQEGLQRVVDELEFAKTHPEEAEKQGISPLLLVMGGGMKGPYCAGQVVALHDAGYGEVFKNVIGFSAGSGPAAYFVAGPEQARQATALFREECTTEAFLSFKRRKIIDTSIIASNMRRGEKKLDVEAIRTSKIGLYTGVTNVETEQVEFVDMKTATRDGDLDMVAACEASSAIPLFEDPFEVNGTEYLDGSLGELPLEELIKKFNPSSILVLPNMAFSEIDTLEQTSVERALHKAATFLSGKGEEAKEESWLTKTAEALRRTMAMKQSSARAIDAIEDMVEEHQAQAVRENTRSNIQAIEDVTDVKIAVLWPPRGGLTNISNDRGTVEAAIMSAHIDVLNQLGKAMPEDIKF